MAQFQKDKGYAWMICFASFMSHFIHCGVLYSMGLFYIIFKKNLKGDSSIISLVPSINTAFNYGIAPIVGALFAKYGGRKLGMLGGLMCGLGLILASMAQDVSHLYLTYGLITGMGIAIQYSPSMAMLPLYFDRWLGLASGIAASGCGVGSVVFPYVIRYLEESYGWRGALLLCGGTQLNLIVCGALYRPTKEQEHHNRPPSSYRYTGADKSGYRFKEDAEIAGISKADADSAEKSKQDAQNSENSSCCSLPRFNWRVVLLDLHAKGGILWDILTIRVFLLFCFAQFVFTAGTSIVYTHLGAYALDRDFEDHIPPLLFLTIGVSSTIGRALVGLVAQQPGFHPLRLCSITALLLGVSTLLTVLYHSEALLIMCAILFGLLCAPLMTLGVMIITEVVPSNLISFALGIQLFFLMPASLMGPPVAGHLYDCTGIYHYSFYLAGCLIIMAGVLTGFAVMALPSASFSSLCKSKDRRPQEVEKC